MEPFSISILINAKWVDILLPVGFAGQKTKLFLVGSGKMGHVFISDAIGHLRNIQIGSFQQIFIEIEYQSDRKWEWRWWATISNEKRGCLKYETASFLSGVIFYKLLFFWFY